MNKDTKINTYHEFNDYYIDTKSPVRSKNNDFHIFRFNELGNKVVEQHGPFETKYYQFALGTSLSAKVSVYNKSFIAEKYSMVIYIPGQIIKWERTGIWDGYIINIKESFLRKAMDVQALENFDFLHDMRPLIFSVSNQEYQALSNVYEMLIAEHEKLNPENFIVVHNLMQVLLVYIKRVIKTSNESHLKESPFSFIQNLDVAINFKRLVFKNYLVDKSVAFYAKELNTSTKALNKQVQKVFNKSPKEFINEVILLHAQTILKNPNCSIKEVCYDLNFDDYSHFAKFFKKMTGQSPAEYKGTSG